MKIESEEKKSKQRAYNKARYEANKQAILVRVKAYNEAHREERKAYLKDWQEENREEQNIKKKAYTNSHKEELKASNKAWREAHKEEQKAYKKTKYEANRKEILSKSKDYRESNREEINARRKARYRTRNLEINNRRHELRYGLSREQESQILALQDNKCQACRREFGSEYTSNSGKILTVKIARDHNHSFDHFRGFLCAACNSALGLMQDQPAWIFGLYQYSIKDELFSKKKAS